MAGSVVDIGKVPELRKRLLFMLGMLAVYRLGIFITIPFVDRNNMGQLVNDGGLLGMFNMFTGGALERASIFALGIMPYISASIIISLLTVVIPTLAQLKKEGESGRKKIDQYTRYGTVLLCSVQALFMAQQLQQYGQAGSGTAEIVTHPGLGFTLMTVLTLTAGSVLLMWIGEQITERGIGNGISLIIFAGIVAEMPTGIGQLFASSPTSLSLILMLILCIGTVAAVCYFETAHRKIPIQYTKRTQGRQEYKRPASFLPLKINISGVIPPIFASALLMLPQQLASWIQTDWMAGFAAALQYNDWRYNVVYVALIVFFTFFYTAVQFDPVEVSDNLKKQGGFIPGIRPGKKTAEYIDYVVTRITCAGAVYLSAVCVTPVLMQSYLNIPFALTNIFAGTGLLIVVGVALDTVQQIQAHLVSRNYQGLTGPTGPRVKGRTSGRRK